MLLNRFVALKEHLSLFVLEISGGPRSWTKFRLPSDTYVTGQVAVTHRKNKDNGVVRVIPPMAQYGITSY